MASSSVPPPPAVDAAAANVASTPAPRKRRRRTAASGAAEDCHTCRKRQIRCDRRRPYCSQCLEIGKDCSGYRTTLTWGVGVASRGKLRGLSLPILNSPPTKQDVSSGLSKLQTSPVVKTTSSQLRAPEGAQTIKREEITPTGFDFGQPIYNSSQFQTTRPIPIPTASANHGWHVPGFTEHLEDYSAYSGNQARLQLRPQPLHRLHTTSSSFDETVFSAPSTGSVSTFSESDNPSPRELPPTPEEVHLTEPFISSYSDAFPCHQESTYQSMESYNYMNIPRSYPTSDYALTSLGSSMGNQTCMDTYPVQSAIPTNFSDFLHRTDYGPVDDMMQQFQYVKPEQEYLQQTMVSPSVPWNGAIPHTLEASNFHHLTPRVRSLIDYYDKAICPVLVAFDSPKNPYRMHVLPLAVTSTSLQNAIAALATNNIRMRGAKELNGYGTDPLDHFSSDDISEISNHPTPEEIHFKATSVGLFNASLKEHGGAGDDSVLATLLVLCLFHVCDSGFSKFKAQLAGVHKLLRMREKQGGSAEFLGWIQMFFTWFDVLTATVNDREAQVRPDSLDMLDLSANLGALEHLSGCEGRLFKLIARLGRLNLLSQNRTTLPNPSPHSAPDFYSLDGNGWGNLISPPAEISASQTPSHDPRQEFWCEWSHIRSRLVNWNPPSGPQPTMTEADHASLHHISEAFRHAALLYTERLGSPQLPPSSAPIQTLVSAALRHISAIPVTSCVNKFLLWPVFIAGTECVNKSDRDIIRQRCVEITRESGFWNNMSCLEVLERVWAEDDLGKGWELYGGQAFRWRKAMLRGAEGVEGDYIVV
ncbi:fungal-specific transcription factor domain-containing protein [Venturia nashicola]|nr:fungal-specific transcription factor domain-containing protein [Venturia nashicola]